MSTFEDAIPVLLDDEGGEFIENDNGRGPSKWGVTLATYQQFHLQSTAADIRNLGKEEAIAFYRKAFWEEYHLGLIDPQPVATKMLDLTANVGPIAIKWLQAACGVPQDMILGSHTAEAVNSMNPNAALAKVRACGEQYYRDLAKRNPEKYGKDLDGWLARLAK